MRSSRIPSLSSSSTSVLGTDPTRSHRAYRLTSRAPRETRVYDGPCRCVLCEGESSKPSGRVCKKEELKKKSGSGATRRGRSGSPAFVLPTCSRSTAHLLPRGVDRTYNKALQGIAEQNMSVHRRRRAIQQHLQTKEGVYRSHQLFVGPWTVSSNAASNVLTSGPLTRSETTLPICGLATAISAEVEVELSPTSRDGVDVLDPVRAAFAFRSSGVVHALECIADEEGKGSSSREGGGKEPRSGCAERAAWPEEMRD